ncbi:MBL fold metallo-hydrolase [Alkalihalobacillus pseudalcaliphilus]|uniref:MBL fold metallo-hydrolase n=1 Tax=Alkalihalobacillus pseudalcaliphilus TaxID=79884 RepID=UPI00064D864C|nr:MBL fold metallo-hydrolase [Alkalihalobacillus pseudalcaliphilus]KMK76969.1 hypothetical protein AB990_05250 [Alkalihalobacillus pseudalcaliphilus]
MPVLQIPLGPLQTNAYILYNQDNEAVIFDPGHESKKLTAIIKDKGLKPLAILLTHAHFDHIGAVEDIRQTFQIPVYVHNLEQDWLENPAKNGSTRFGESIVANAADQLIHEDDTLQIGPFSFSTLHTPGHSPGSVSYYFQDEHVVFSGDVLFQQSIGRTDLPGGEHQTLLHSIHTKLLHLPEETAVACGHGPATSIGAEMDSNPFLSGF